MLGTDFYWILGGKWNKKLFFFLMCWQRIEAIKLRGIVVG